MKDNKNYPIIDVPASGNPEWAVGARTMIFVYSKHHGNFILRGYLKEVREYLKQRYTHYFYYISMWCKGESRGFWEFWKDDVDIYRPHRRSRIREHRRYRVKNTSLGGNEGLSFRRLPKRWIPEFDEL